MHNPNNHECMKCEYGSVWKERGVPMGNVCKHAKVICKPGLGFGRYHRLRRVPKWCPVRKER